MTLEQVADQWQGAVHKFSLNVWNFTVLGSDIGEKVFQESFKLRRFNSQGSSNWPLSKNKNQSGRPRGTLIENGNLVKSIVGEAKKGGEGAKKGKNMRMYFHTSFKGLSVDERDDFRSIKYAATHNDGNPPGSGPNINSKMNRQRRASAMAKYMSQSSRKMPQRQFMPTKYGETNSTVLDEKLEQLEIHIFQGLPATKIT